MSAEALRRAAALMRERAEAAPKPGGRGTEYGKWSRYFDRFRRAHNGHDRALADYCAHMHPAVALAVADWLDEAADEFGAQVGSIWIACAQSVARAYMGEAS